MAERAQRPGRWWLYSARQLILSFQRKSRGQRRCQLLARDQKPMALAMGFLFEPAKNQKSPMADTDRMVRIALPAYVDIEAVTRERGEQFVLPESYTPEDELQRRGDFAQNARDVGNTLLSAKKGGGQIAGACLVMWSLIVSLQEGVSSMKKRGPIGAKSLDLASASRVARWR